MTEKKKYIPKTKDEILRELKQIDTFNLLKVKSKERQAGVNDILISRFEEINNFIDEFNRRPSDKGNGEHEFTLYSRLLEIQLDPRKYKPLIPYDRHGLLVGLDTEDNNQKIIELESQEQNTSKLGLADTFNLLKSPGDSIFNLTNVKAREEKVTTMPEEVAKRKKCNDFQKFEALFKKCQNEIESGDRAIVQFRNEQDVTAGAFFIYGGIKCYVAEIGEKEIKNKRNNARLRLIFENGLESNMYLRSLTAELYKDGRRILPSRIKEGQTEISAEELTGYIYILTSKSENSDIRSIPNLHKIGFSTTPVKDRIRNAKNDTTYLMADVQLIVSYKVSNIKPTYFENLVHRIFSHVQLNIEIAGHDGKLAKPKEWYSVPYDVIEDAIRLIESGEIIQYVYESNSQRLIKKD